MPSKKDLCKHIDCLLTQSQIAEIYNVNQATVSNWFKRYNLKSKVKVGGAHNIKDLVNQKFGDLTVLKLDRMGSHGKEYLCRCKCGNYKVYRGSTLTSGAVSGCGCNVGKSNKGKTKDKYARSKIGEVFNLLTVIGVDNSNVGENKLICRCNCGKITKQIYADIVTEKVKSCGCYQREQASKIGSTIGLNNYKNKYKWYFIKNEQKVYCRSGYEVIYANFLIRNSIDFNYEPRCFKLDNGERYTPDFYLIKEDVYIEIKGSFEINKKYNYQEEKIEKFREKHKHKLLYWDDIVKHCKLPLKAYSSYLRRARRLKISEEDYLANMMYLKNI